MKCANHPLNDAFAYCGQCGRAVCNDCKREVGGMTYCESCLSARLHSPLPPWGSVGVGPSPGWALALGFIPGVGAIYNGQISKAILQVLIFGSFIALGDREGGLGSIAPVAATAFYFYMVIDSFQTAKAKALGKPAPDWFGLSEAKLNAPIGAALLIALGALFLLDNLGVPVIRQIGKFWPLLLIGAGLFLLQRYVGGPKPQPPAGPPASEKPPEGPSNIPGPRGL
jgi:hypothetical protein